MVNINATTFSLIGEDDIGDEGAIAIANSLLNNSTIEVLHLGNNNIGDEGTKAIAEMLHENKHLTKLYLCHFNCENMQNIGVLFG